jgi:hypothetical protein
MIKTPTVFILGAGASKAYGFPLGGGLVSQICNHSEARQYGRFGIRNRSDIHERTASIASAFCGSLPRA